MARKKTPELVKKAKAGPQVLMPAGAPEIPRPLSPVALAEWNRVAPLLIKLGTLTDADGDALATYCDTIARYKKCQAQLDKEGMTVATTQGTSAHPLLLEMRTCQRFMRDFENDYGMRHLARLRIKLQPKEDKKVDPFDAFLAEKPALTENAEA